MKKLKFCYHLRMDFEQDALDHHFTFRCTPYSDLRQTITSCETKIEPESLTFCDTDGFGNHLIIGNYAKSHRYIDITVTGSATTESAKNATNGYRSCCVSKEDSCMVGMFKAQTFMTTPGENIKRFYDSLPLSTCKNIKEKAYLIMTSLYGHMKYVPGCTDIFTTAEMAFTQGKGVCQDYAHIMLSLCRLANISSRYVTGMMIGEGFSHAWVEVECEDGFYGYDPTNNLEVNDVHIKLSHGRDSEDCLINRGVMRGGGLQTQTIHVNVFEE